MKGYTKYDYFFENLFVYKNNNSLDLIYNYCIDDINKLTLNKLIDDLNFKNKFFLRSICNLPLSTSEIFNLKILVNDLEIEDYTIMYRNNSPPPIKDGFDEGFLPGFNKDDVSFILIRSDFGHGKGKIHTNIDYYKESEDKPILISKPNENFIPHDIDKFNKYNESGIEQIVNVVLEQAEKLNPFVGIKYWLLSFLIGLDEIQLFNAWKRSKIETPLCILSNNIRNKMINEYVGPGKRMTNDTILKIGINLIEEIGFLEKSDPDSIPFYPISDEFIKYQFPFPTFCVEGFNFKM
jgi:hypothetical protein